MKNWNRLFVRQGFLFQEVSDGRFDCREETTENIEFLLETLDELFVSYTFANGLLKIYREAILEEEWLKAVDIEWRGRTEMLSFDVPPLKQLDTYMAGFVRQLNRLGLATMYCCDGHGKRLPQIGFARDVDMELVEKVLNVIGVPKWQKRNQNVSLRLERHQLLDLAEILSALSSEMISESIDELSKQLFFKNLEECLLIDGESGNEGAIRGHVLEKMKPLVDRVTLDQKGNILAQKVYGQGSGPVILLNAHLDTVCGFEENREIVKDGTIWTSSYGILGADDRAGVAVLLELAKRLTKFGFNGTVKFIFTVEEEIGLKGAKEVAEYFLWDVDAAFVVDRRGTGDIVTSCGGSINFCDEAFGTFVEEVAKNANLESWHCTAGGSSDTRIWASHGIQSVNLSVGYMNEHTEDEVLDVEACYGTFKLLSRVFEEANELKRTVREIKRKEIKV
ncbi:M20/M25/M40 family metallo-hydrolase [Planococcus shixiaomingii]|uniref:M20/M25/M40 family metallo-hydrolase n=1 Tax=Planococcus shixiaomingii TaxID=3058393 RepID=UPI00261FD6E3|nr:M20/M25/M40 family metallo-hydrolase [Planococcus sp. N022]WKA53180.1 M20/M25/M40 family metallo-hydrolase [Planococcus sp. N022]